MRILRVIISLPHGCYSTGRTGILPVHGGKEAAERGAGKSRKDPGAYATAYYRSSRNFAKVDKARYEGCATLANPTWRVF